MHRRFFTAVLTVALLGLAGAVQADPVIYDNGVTGGSAWASQLSNNIEFNAQTADDFMLPVGDQGWRVTDVHWEGTGGFGDEIFRIIFYADDGGVPTGGGGLADPTPTALAERVVLVTAMDDPADGDQIYWADIEPVILSGGTNYWLVIQAVANAQSSLTQWFWSADTREGNAVLGFDLIDIPFWENELNSEMVFSLTGTQVPAPGAALLAMLGMPAIGWVKRRFA